MDVVNETVLDTDKGVVDETLDRPAVAAVEYKFIASTPPQVPVPPEQLMLQDPSLTFRLVAYVVPQKH